MTKCTAEEEQAEGSAPVYHPNHPIPASRAAATLTIHAQGHAVEREGLRYTVLPGRHSGSSHVRMMEGIRLIMKLAGLLERLFAFLFFVEFL